MNNTSHTEFNGHALAKVLPEEWISGLQ